MATRRKPAPRPRLRDRSTSDILILLVAFTVCFTAMAGGASLILIEVLSPETDTTPGLRTITGIINTLIGLLAGFLAGRTGAALSDREGKEDST